MPDTEFSPGEICYLTAGVCNPDMEPLEGIILFVILDVYGSYFFAPSWTEGSDGIDFFDGIWESGRTDISVIPAFPWPEGTGYGQNLIFWGALTDADVTGIYGEIDSLAFGWTE